jgi:hypothetical protein
MSSASALGTQAADTAVVERSSCPRRRGPIMKSGWPYEVKAKAREYQPSHLDG